MTKVDRFEELLMKYLKRFDANYFVSSYENIYDYLRNEYEYEDEKEFFIDYGRLWGIQRLSESIMSKEDAEELLDLILSL